MRMKKLRKKRPSEPSQHSCDGQDVPKIDDFKDVFNPVTNNDEEINIDYEKSLAFLQKLIEMNGG